MTAEDIYEDVRRNAVPLTPRASTKTKLGRSKSSSNQGTRPSGKPFDRHLDPAEPHGAWARGRDFPTPAERRRMREAWASELRAALPGRLAGDAAQEIAKAGDAQVDWRAVLHQFASGVRRDDYRLFPPNKKHIWRGIMLPALGAPGPSHIVSAVDTSGSMDTSLLGSVLTEIDSLRSIMQSTLTLIECDAAIQTVTTYEPWELAHLDFSHRSFRGRGGTDFRPPFEWTERCYEAGLPPADALIYLTDGFGPFPERAPHHPTLWIAFSRVPLTPPFGSTINIGTA